MTVIDIIYASPSEALYNKITGEGCRKLINRKLSNQMSFSSRFKHFKEKINTLLISCGNPIHNVGPTKENEQSQCQQIMTSDLK